jgi:hypothetical protein
VRDRAKKSGVGVGREDPTIRGFSENSAELARLEHADDDMFPDPAFYLRFPNRGLGEVR